MKPAVQRPWPAWQRTLGLLVACVLAACGPGVGGSGTGAEEDPLKVFGATALPVCGSALGPQLASCIKDQTVLYADSALQPRVTAQVQDNLIRLQAPCAALTFSGEWAAVGERAPRFYGTVTSANGTALASLITAPAGTDGLRIELRDGLDPPLLGPLTLAPAVVDAAIGNCS